MLIGRRIQLVQNERTDNWIKACYNDIDNKIVRVGTRGGVYVAFSPDLDDADYQPDVVYLDRCDYELA